METKQLIVNGSLNPSLTSEDFLRMEDAEMIQAAQYLQTALISGHSLFYPLLLTVRPDFYREAYEKSAVPTFAYSELLEGTKEKLELLLKARVTVRIHYLDKLHKEEYLQGGKIYKLQKDLDFSGRFNLTPHQLKGYISARGSWNNFEVNEVKRAIRILEDKMPVRNYGVNNPNTGMRQHQWSIESDYIYLKTPYISKHEEMEQWAIFFSTFEVYFEGAKADSTQSTRLSNEVTDTGFEFYAWWD